MNKEELVVIFCDCHSQFHAKEFYESSKSVGKFRSIVHCEDFSFYLKGLPVDWQKAWDILLNDKFRKCGFEIYFPSNPIAPRDGERGVLLSIEDISKTPGVFCQWFERLTFTLQKPQLKDHTRHFISIFSHLMPHTIPFSYNFQVHLTKPRVITKETINDICKAYNNSIIYT